jgi:hypothetical protein
MVRVLPRERDSPTVERLRLPPLPAHPRGLVTAQRRPTTPPQLTVRQARRYGSRTDVPRSTRNRRRARCAAIRRPVRERDARRPHGTARSARARLSAIPARPARAARRVRLRRAHARGALGVQRARRADRTLGVDARAAVRVAHEFGAARPTEPAIRQARARRAHIARPTIGQCRTGGDAQCARVREGQTRRVRGTCPGRAANPAAVAAEPRPCARALRLADAQARLARRIGTAPPSDRGSIAEEALRRAEGRDERDQPCRPQRGCPGGWHWQPIAS